MKKKTLTMLIALVLVLTCAVGGTLAWLSDKTEPVVNTFSPSDINIELTETTTNYQMIPGHDIAKDPEVTVKANSEDCYLFVKIDKSANYATYLAEYTPAEGWFKLQDGVYYREVVKANSAQEFPVLANNKVTVNTTVTKSDMEAIDGVDAEGNEVKAEIDARPTLTFTAYATQLYKEAGVKFTPAEAWTNAQTQ